MYHYLEGSDDVTTAPVQDCVFDLLHKLVACFLVIGFGVFFGLVFIFLPFLFIIELANKQTEKAKITKTYQSLIKRYYNNTLCDRQ